LKLTEYESVKRWLSAKSYTKETRVGNLEHLAIWCGVLHLTPDELVRSEPVETQKRLSEALRDELEYKPYTIHSQMSTFHAFLKANCVEITRDLLDYKRCEWLRESSKF
jgi:hypothetical protein